MLAPSRTNVSSLSSSSSSAYDNVAVYSHLEAISNQRGTVSTFQRGQASDAGDMRRAGNVVSRGGVYVGSGGAGGTVGGGPSGPSGLVGGPSTGTGGGLGGMNLGPGGVGGGPGGTAGGTGGGGEFQDAGDEDEDGIMCLARCPACERCIAWCDNRSEGAKPFNLHTKFICLLLIIYAGFVTATARGLFAILQGVLGIIFAIEGLWNSARYYPAGIRKFIGFLVLYVLCSAGIGTFLHVGKCTCVHSTHSPFLGRLISLFLFNYLSQVSCT